MFSAMCELQFLSNCDQNHSWIVAGGRTIPNLLANFTYFSSVAEVKLPSFALAMCERISQSENKIATCLPI